MDENVFSICHIKEEINASRIKEGVFELKSLVAQKCVIISRVSYKQVSY